MASPRLRRTRRSSDCSSAGWSRDRSCLIFFFSSRRRHTRLQGDWSSDVCSSDLRHPQRDALAKRLADTGVGTAVHYPLPVPGQPLFAADGEKRWPEAHRAAREVLSLPCYPEMSDAEEEGVIDAVRRACEDLG